MGNIVNTRNTRCSRMFQEPVGRSSLCIVVGIVDLRRECDPGTINITSVGRRRTNRLHIHSTRCSTRSTVSAQSKTGLSTSTCGCHRKWRRHWSISCVRHLVAQQQAARETEDSMTFLVTKFFNYSNSIHRCPTWWLNSASIVSFDGSFESKESRCLALTWLVFFLKEFHRPSVLEITIVRQWCV